MKNTTEQDLAHVKKVFCNRSLNLKNIKAIGFDMDYTLGLYYPETFEVLAYQETLKKLVKMGYPDQILEWKFDWTYMIRGLIIDKSKGNIIKVDRHHYVKVAMHGFKELSREDRRKLYDASQIRVFEEPQFVLIDTLFSLAEAYLFCQLVELKDKYPDTIHKSYQELYKDVRFSIDNAHKDGSIKNKVAENPAQYIARDPLLVKTLQKLKDSGRKLFIVTNSLWEYTNIVMSYLFDHSPTDPKIPWLSFFDLVIVGASKPSFFMHPNPIYEVDAHTGYLKNIPYLSNDSKVLQGGNFRHLHELLKITTGSEILYVGDHIYGDILRSKKEIGWRTMLVIEELEKELLLQLQNAELYSSIEKLRNLKEISEDKLQNLLWQLEISLIHSDTIDAENHNDSLSNLREEIRLLAAERNDIRETLREHIREYHSRFHPIWGQLLKTGHQNSRFAQQVEVYACLYTSKLSNLWYHAPSKPFQSTPDRMPHEL